MLTQGMTRALEWAVLTDLCLPGSRRGPGKWPRLTSTCSRRREERTLYGVPKPRGEWPAWQGHGRGHVLQLQWALPRGPSLPSAPRTEQELLGAPGDLGQQTVPAPQYMAPD